MPEASRGRIPTNINERFAAMQVKGGGYKRESVVVIIDATGDELNLEGLDWALLNVVEPGKNKLIVLGIFQESQPYSLAWELFKSVSCCSSRASRDKKLNQKIGRKMEAFNLGLQDSVLLQQKDATKVHVRVTAGFSPIHTIALQETAALSASWVVIDRTLKGHRKFFAEQMSCNVVLMKSRSEAEVLRIHQDQLAGKSPASLDDMSLDSVMLADISRAILAREREQLHYSDAYGEVPPEAISPRSWKQQHQQGPAPLPPKRPYYTSPKVRTPAREFYSGSFSLRTADPSIEVSWFEPAHDASEDNNNQHSSTLDHDSDTDHSYTTPSPADARASANSRTLGQTVRDRLLPPPRVSAEPPPPLPALLPVEVPAAPADGYSSDTSSQSELESEHGGHTPRGLSTILQDQRTMLGLKHLTVTTFGDERPVDEPPPPSQRVLTMAPTEETDMPEPLLPCTRLDLRQRAASASSSICSSPRTAVYFGSSRPANKQNQQQQPPGVMPRLATSPALTARSQGRAYSVRSDSPAMSIKSAASPTRSFSGHFSTTPARSTRSNRSSARDSSASAAHDEEVYPRLGHPELLSPPRFNFTKM